jgi:peptide/nickel transport system permease protein
MVNIKKILLSPCKALARIIKMSRKTMTGSLIFIAFIIISIVEPIIDNYRLNGKSPLTIGIFDRLLPPSLELPLGTDPYGRDLFGLLLMGTKFTLTIGIVAGIVGTLISVFIGTLAGYKGGLMDHILRSITDTMIVIPTWPIIILLVAYLRQLDIFALSLIIAILSWPWVARSLRSQILSVKERPFIELAKVSGLGDLEIIFKEILPNVLPYIGVGFTNATLGALLAETGIRFLGVGPVYIPTLGYLVNLSMQQGFLTTRLYALIPPILFLVLVFCSLNLVNIGLDEVYNPRLKKVTGL